MYFLHVWTLCLFSRIICYELDASINGKESTLDHTSDTEEIHSNDTKMMERLFKMSNCKDKPLEKTVGTRGHFLVFYNFVQSTTTSRCHTSVTYTTHADFGFFDNLETLADRWSGPISLAVYAPGKDFDVSLRSIAYLRNCRHSKIRKYVNFHLFFDRDHVPEVASSGSLLFSYKDLAKCNQTPPYEMKKSLSYRFTKNLTYPINVARNIALQSAQTHFVFASDVELYPSADFIYKFLQMLVANPQHQVQTKSGVYVAPVFELVKHSVVPRNKTELQMMLRNKTAVLFHHTLCPMCHRVPKMKEWMTTDETDSYDVFAVGSRTKSYIHWEPFYVGTKNDPEFDERLTWEGQSNKITQAYSMCLLDYDYMVLNNAFLVHRPGIKKAKDQIVKYAKYVWKTNKLLRDAIHPELLKIYGHRKGCVL